MSTLRQGMTFLFCATLLVIAQLLLKRGIGGFGHPELSLGGAVRLIRYIVTTPTVIAGYLVGFVAGLFWLSALSVVNLTLAGPAMMGIYFLELLIFSRIFLKESISPMRWVGALLILGGMLILARTSASVASPGAEPSDRVEIRH
jgi:drug/metabolite transporter (DMT)-like permease